ncbi:MAG: YkgJ family cysteine cluster protein [Bacteroidetes bacterium]|nr:YkgJ family cysteine cluster protein [Bacteroidota bacterium]
MISPSEINKNNKKFELENRKFFNRLKKRPPSDIDQEVQLLDELVFSKINCLDCANCCKTISPVFKERDITRLSTHFKMRPAEFTNQFLYLDNEGDYVLKSTPCPFLLADNKCSVYEHRPFACKSYPHTATLPIRKSWELIIKNSAVCPAVYEITSILKKKYK